MKDKSKRLAYLLRHDTEYNFPKDGWREVSDLVKNHGYTRSELEKIVEVDNKGRYEFSQDKKRVRARQGHSVKVDVDLDILTPPNVLYHGTALRFLESIKREGIIRKTRLYVQMCDDPEWAKKIGERHGKPVVLEIDTERMSSDGIIFKKSRNNIWMTEYVDPKYIKLDKIRYYE